MDGKIILNLAVSLDGYISDENGGFDWIVGQNDKSLDTEKQLVFDDFVKGIDIVVMGKNCYNQGFHKDYKNKMVYIATNESLEDYENVHFIKGDIVSILEERKRSGENIFLFGGGVVIDPFIQKNAIDEYIIGFIPTILGKGRPLFLGDNKEINLNLDEYYVSDGIVVMKYSKRRK
ncbi:MAG: dihydrofolate reductase family protein [Clostridium sp.]